MFIYSSISEIIMKFYREEYLTIVRGIIHNFTFDDKQDELFNHNWLINRKTD